MTNDFVLFPDPADGDAMTDADVALITAYLSRELSPVQIAAIEERLETDAAFRESVGPIIEVWTAQGRLYPRVAAEKSRAPATSLTAEEMEIGWRRYTRIVANGDVPPRVPASRTSALTPTQRKPSMSRIAAIIAVTVLPVLAVAQVVRYFAANRRAEHDLVPPAVRSIGDAQRGRELTVAQGQSVAAGQAAAEAQAVAVVDLPPAAARTKERLKAILGLQQTVDGGVIVNDPLRQQLLMFSRDLATAVAILDSVPGNSKSYADGGTARQDLYPDQWRVFGSYVGDSSVWGPKDKGALVIDGRGAIIRAITVGPVAWSFLRGATFWDPQGRLLYVRNGALRTDTIEGRPGGVVTQVRVSDSIAIFRAASFVPALDMGGNRILEPKGDTVGFIHVPQNRTPRTAGLIVGDGVGNGGGRLVKTTANGKTTHRQVINPLYFVDDWAMLSDGTVALVRGNDYHVDWIHLDGARTSSGKLPYNWRRLTDADKQRIIDSTRSAVDSMDAVAVVNEERWKPWKDSVAKVARAAGARMISGEVAHEGPPVRFLPYEIVPATQMADYYPPIGPRASKADADGNLWILPRTTSLSRRGELIYDVVNPTRGLVQRVRLPIGRSIAGFGKGGVVYLMDGDMKNGFYLERSTLPAPIPK